MCVCACVCMYNFVHMCAEACMCIAMWVGGSVIYVHSTRQPWVSFIRYHQPFFFPFRQSLLLAWYSPNMPGWLGNKPQRCTYPCFSTSEVTGVHCCTWHFHRRPGNRTQVLVLSKHGWAISPLPSVPLPAASILFSLPLHYWCSCSHHVLFLCRYTLWNRRKSKKREESQQKGTRNERGFIILI